MNQARGRVRNQEPQHELGFPSAVLLILVAPGASGEHLSAFLYTVKTEQE